MSKLVIHRWKFVARDYVSSDIFAERFESGRFFNDMLEAWPRNQHAWPEDERYDREKRPVLIKERVQ